jgi:hypothetical protein
MARTLPLLMIGCVALLAACSDVKQGPVPKACTRAHDQCTMPSGVLGVCNVVDCAAGQPEPCLVCRSQH